MCFVNINTDNGSLFNLYIDLNDRHNGHEINQIHLSKKSHIFIFHDQYCNPKKAKKMVEQKNWEKVT